MDNYILWASHKKNGTYNGRQKIATLSGDDKIAELSQIIYEWCNETDTQNVAIDLFASINFECGVDLFDVARQFPNQEPRTYTYFYVQRIKTETDTPPKNDMSDIPF